MLRRWIMLVSSCLLVACGEHGDHAAPSTVPLDGIGPAALFVIDGGDATITVIDPATDAVVGEIVLEGVEYPHHASFDASGDRLFVAVPGVDLSGGHGGHAGHDSAPVHGMVLALAAGTGELLAYHELAAANHNAIASPNGAEVVAGAGAHAIAFSADATKAYVTNQDAGTVAVVHVTSGEVVATVEVGRKPNGMALRRP